jgi:hypothetical protein
LNRTLPAVVTFLCGVSQYLLDRSETTTKSL